MKRHIVEICKPGNTWDIRGRAEKQYFVVGIPGFRIVERTSWDPKPTLLYKILMKVTECHHIELSETYLTIDAVIEAMEREFNDRILHQPLYGR